MAIVRHYAHPHGFIAGEDDLRSIAEALELQASHYRIEASVTEYPKYGRAWNAKADRFANLAKNIRQILADGL
jgi:hypothetical protein